MLWPNMSQNDDFAGHMEVQGDGSGKGLYSCAHVQAALCRKFQQQQQQQRLDQNTQSFQQPKEMMHQGHVGIHGHDWFRELFCSDQDAAAVVTAAACGPLSHSTRIPGAIKQACKTKHLFLSLSCFAEDIHTVRRFLWE